MWYELELREKDLRGVLYALKLKQERRGRTRLERLTNTAELDTCQLAKVLAIPARLSLYERHELKTDDEDATYDALLKIMKENYSDAVKALEGVDDYFRVSYFMDALRYACILSEAWKHAHAICCRSNMEDPDETPMTLEELGFFLGIDPKKINKCVFSMVEREGDEEEI